MISVEADALESALWKACLILDCGTEELAYIQVDTDDRKVRLHVLALTQTSDGSLILEPPCELSEPLALKPPLGIEDDILPTEGRTAHFGDIAIFGCVRAGAHVRARGKVTVWGDVESAASVIASESIIVKGGLLGTARAIRGDVHSRYANGAAIVGRNVNITEDAIQTRIASTGKIDIGGMFCGGVASGRLQVDAAIIGASGSATQTRVSAGQAKHLSQLTKRSTELQAQAKSEWASDFFAANSSRSLAISAVPVTARITAHETIYPGSRVKIDQASLEIEREMHQATFWKDADTGMLMMSHHEFN